MSDIPPELVELARTHDSRCRCAACRALSEYGEKPRCIAITMKGTRCPIGAEGNGYCHVHDPELTYRQQFPTDYRPLTIDDDKLIFDSIHDGITLGDLAKRLDVDPEPLASRIRVLDLSDVFRIQPFKFKECIGITKAGLRCTNPALQDNLTCCEAHAISVGVEWNGPKTNRIDPGYSRTITITVTKKAKQESVYIFWLGFEGLYKIGYSSNWKQRLVSLKASNPHIKPILIVDGTRSTEKEIQRLFSDYHYERETFKLDKKETLFTLIRDILTSGIKIKYIDNALKKSTIYITTNGVGSAAKAR